MSQESDKPLICTGSFNPPQNPMIQRLLFHSFKHEKIETYGGKESCPRLYNLQVIVESELELEASTMLSARHLATVQTLLIHFQTDLIRTLTNHPKNTKVYWI